MRAVRPDCQTSAARTPDKIEPTHPMTRLFENTPLALTGNAVVGLVTLTDVELSLKISLLAGSCALTFVTLFYKVKNRGK